MATYYVDAVNGSDSNSGTSAATAFQSLAKASNIKLKPGDNLLLARGSSFTDMLTINGSGSIVDPVTIGAYGEGADPAFVGRQGIYGTKTSNIVIKDVTFSTAANALYAAKAENWVIDNVKLLNAGQETGTGSISLKSSINVTISNSTFDGVQSDAIYVREMDGLNIVNNVITNVRGHTGDGIQVTDSKNVRVEGNRIDLTTSMDSTKGGIVMNNTTGVVTSENHITGGSFGITINGWDVVITANVISGQVKYGWSAGIMVGAGMNLGNYKISGNEVTGSNYGVSITGLQSDGLVTRENMHVTGNTFADIVGAAIKIDKPATGSFNDNVIIDSILSLIRGSGLNSPFTFGNNQHVTAPQQADAVNSEAYSVARAQAEAAAKAQAEAIAKAQADAAAAKAHAEAIAKAQAEAAAKAQAEAIAKAQADAAAAKAQADAIAKAQAEAAAKAQADAAALKAQADAIAKAQAGASAAKAHNDVASENLNKVQKIGINADKYVMDVSGGKVVGNVLDNDVNAAGTTLSLRAVEGTRVSAKGVDIKGDYGTLHIEQDGDFSYALNASALAKLKGIAAPTERFQYKAADGGKLLTSSVSIDLSAYVSTQDPNSAAAKAAQAAAQKAGQPIERVKAVDDFYKVDHRTLSVSGNVSVNDVTADGSTLSLRTVGGANLSGGAANLAGKYGALHIDATGAFTYTLYGDAASRMLSDHKTSDSFAYKAALAGSYDTGALVIDLSAHVAVHAQDTLLI